MLPGTVLQPTFNVPAYTPTVPPAGWAGNIADFFKSGLDIYKSYNEAKAAAKAPAAPTVVVPAVVSSPQTVQTPGTPAAGQTPFIPQSNQVYVRDVERVGQQGQDYTVIFIVIGLLALVLAFLKIK